MRSKRHDKTLLARTPGYSKGELEWNGNGMECRCCCYRCNHRIDGISRRLSLSLSFVSAPARNYRK